MPARGRIPLRDYPAQRIALIKPSALGDIVHALPVLTALRRRYPAAHITWVVNRGYEPLLRGHPDLDATMAFDRRAIRSAGPLDGLAFYGRFLRACREQHFDLVIDLQGLLRSGLMVLACGAPRRVGLSTAREGARWFYTDVIPVADFNALHAVERYWLVAEALGAGGGPKEFRVAIPEAERRWADELLNDCPRPWLGIAVGSRWITKRWPPRSFAELARRVQERYGGTAILVGSAGEAALSQTMAAELAGPVRDLTGQTLLPQLAALLARIDVMLANDTGPLHLAAALGRPVVAPYTCTKVLLNGPYGTDGVGCHGSVSRAGRTTTADTAVAPGGAVEANVWCQGSYLKRCARLECMAALTPDHLWPMLHGVLRTWESNRRSA